MTMSVVVFSSSADPQVRELDIHDVEALQSLLEEQGGTKVVVAPGRSLPKSDGKIEDKGEWTVELINANTGAAFSSGPQTVTVIPEPSSSLLMALAGLGLLSRRRRS